MNLYHIKLTYDQKSALEHLFAQDIVWRRTDLSEAWDELRKQVREASRHVAMQESGCNCNRKTPTKYDPCRPFKRGDVVEVRIRDGRIPWGTLTSGSRIKLYEKRRYIVSTDENRNTVRIDPIMGIMEIAHTNVTVDVCYLELIAPVEELDRYHLNEIFDIDDGKLIGYEVARGDARDTIFYGGENHLRTIAQAKAAAEDECKRLNEEYRKEQDENA